MPRDEIILTKKEYSQLLEEIANYKQSYENSQKIIDKILMPFFENGINQDIINKIFDNAFECKIGILADPRDDITQIRVIYFIKEYFPLE